MNTVAQIVGYLVIWSLVAAALAVPVGKLIARHQRSEPEQQQDMQSRPPFTGYLDPHRSWPDVKGRREQDTSPPSDPAS